MNRRPKNAHAGALCGTVEVGAELAVVVADDELGRGAEGRGLPELLRRWVPSYPDMHDLFGVNVDNEETRSPRRTAQPLLSRRRVISATTIYRILRPPTFERHIRGKTAAQSKHLRRTRF